MTCCVPFVLSPWPSFSLLSLSSFTSNSSLVLPPKLISLILSTMISPPSSVIILSTPLWILNSMPFCVKLLKGDFCPSMWASLFFEISKLILFSTALLSLALFEFLFLGGCSGSSSSCSSTILSSFPYIVFIKF